MNRFAWRVPPGPLLPLAVILCLGGWLRLTHLNAIPPGLWLDEALNGQDAVAVWQPGGEGFRMVYPEEYPREPLYITLLACAVRVLGPVSVTLRLVSALIGIAALVLVFGMARALAGPRVGLLAAAVLATLFWHVLFSRLVFRTNLLAPWMAALVWTVVAWRRRPALWRAALAGVLIGGGFYTYLAWYFMALLWVPLVLWIASRDRAGAAPRPPASPLLCLGLAALVALPLLVHYVRHPEDLMARAGQVSVTNLPPTAAAAEVLENAWEALGMFHLTGDHVAKQNLPWRPALDPVQGLFFLIGLALCARSLRSAGGLPRPHGAILLGWIAAGLLPTIFTITDSPNFLRTLVLTPAVATVTALGLAWAAERAAARTGRIAALSLLALALGYSTFQSHRTLHEWSRREDVYLAFQGDLADIARFAQTVPPEAPLYVPDFFGLFRSFQFQTIGLDNLYYYKDWSFLGPWPTDPRQAGLPPPPYRIVIATAANRAYEPLRALGGRDARFFARPGGAVWGAAVAFLESDLPDTATLRLLPPLPSF